MNLVAVCTFIGLGGHASEFSHKTGRFHGLEFFDDPAMTRGSLMISLNDLS